MQICCCSEGTSCAACRPCTCCVEVTACCQSVWGRLHAAGVRYQCDRMLRLAWHGNMCVVQHGITWAAHTAQVSHALMLCSCYRSGCNVDATQVPGGLKYCSGCKVSCRRSGLGDSHADRWAHRRASTVQCCRHDKLSSGCSQLQPVHLFMLQVAAYCSRECQATAVFEGGTETMLPLLPQSARPSHAHCTVQRSRLLPVLLLLLLLRRPTTVPRAPHHCPAFACPLPGLPSR